MRKIPLIIFLTFAIYSNLFGQSWATDSAYYAQSLPPNIYPILDSLEEKSQQCVFHALGIDYFGVLVGSLEDGDVCVMLVPYQKDNIERFIKSYWGKALPEDRAFTIHNGHLFLMYNVTKLFSLKFDTMKCFSYPIVSCYFSPNLGCDLVSIDFDYRNGEFCPKSNILYQSRRVYVYSVQENDTWESIESIIKVPLSAEDAGNIKTKRALKSPPHKGMNIVIAYSIQDEKLSVRYFRISQ